MKYIFSFFLLVTCMAEQPAWLPSKITIVSKDLVLKDYSGDAKSGFSAEYIPESENFESWTYIFAIHFYPGTQLDALESAKQTAKSVDARKSAGDPIANQMLMTSKSDSAVLLDFLVSSDQHDLFEHNFWSYAKKAKGLLAYRIARRIYIANSDPNTQRKFIASVKHVRTKLISEISRTDLPYPPFVK